MSKHIQILIVDDLSAMRQIIRNLLNELGYDNIVEAVDGLAAFAELETGKIDFLITDWNMPGMDGLDLLRAVRSDEALAKLPVLMVTAEARREQIVAAGEAGVNGYIVKPFTATTLGSKIDRILKLDGDRC